VQNPERGIVKLGLSEGTIWIINPAKSKQMGRDRSRRREGGGDRTPHSNIVGTRLQEGMVVPSRCVDRLMFKNEVSSPSLNSQQPVDSKNLAENPSAMILPYLCQRQQLKHAPVKFELFFSLRLDLERFSFLLII